VTGREPLHSIDHVAHEVAARAVFLVFECIRVTIEIAAQRPIESSDWHISLCHTYCATVQCIIYSVYINMMY